MKAVRDIFVDALGMKRQGLSTQEIAAAIVRSGNENGFSEIVETGQGKGIEIRFPNGELIRFDGTDWHHVRP